ncbi:MAG: cyclic nucleotide-binding domain-containing protein [Actinobacteria bacterium]|nr:cyclic nucleotide-binding domain-containing protein [Actinomycetota bacterium]
MSHHPGMDVSTPRIESLRRIELFSELSDASLANLAERMTELDFEPGYVLVHRGMPGSGMFVIESGKVVVDLTSRQVELGPGDALGELALLNDTVHTGRARAVSRVRAVAIGRDEFAELLESEPAIARCLLSVLARRLAETT